MPAWALLIFKDVLLPFILEELVKYGVMNKVQADAIQSYEDFMTWAKTIKTYPEYPEEGKKAGLP